jgi:transcriptional adapter 2-alpha
LQSYRSQGIKSSQSAKVYEKLLEKRTLMKAKKIKAFEEIRKANKIMSTLQDSNITNSKTSSATTARPKQTTAPLNITYSPGVDLLHDEEKEICTVHRILPDVYLRCKNAMITENKKSGSLRLMDARKLCRIDVNKTRKIYNYLISKNLIHLKT